MFCITLPKIKDTKKIREDIKNVNFIICTFHHATFHLTVLTSSDFSTPSY